MFRIPFSQWLDGVSSRVQGTGAGAWKRYAAAVSCALALSGTAASAQVPVVVPGKTAVGQTAAAVSVTVTMTAAGTGAVTTALTQGVSGYDYSLAAGSACDAKASYTPGSLCTVQVLFAPKYPGLRTGAVVVTSDDGRLLGSTLLSGNATGSLAVFTYGIVNTVAGNGELLFRGDGYGAIYTPIYLPQGLLLDPAGNMYLSDTNNNRVRRVNKSDGKIFTIAGTGTPGFSGDWGQGASAAVNQPTGMVMDGAGNLYFADSGNNVVRRIDAVSGIITTVAGTPGVPGYSGDGSTATSARLYTPKGVTLDAAGNLYIADTSNNVVRKVSASTGVITTIAGTGIAGYRGDGAAAAQAQLDTPWTVAFSPDGLLHIADLGNNVIRKISASGLISTVAGTGVRGFSGEGGSALAANLNDPAAITFNPAGDLYIADSENNRIRRVDASGTITTIVGEAKTALNGTSFGGDGDPANEVDIYAPYALYFDQSGNLFFADTLHNRIRVVSASPYMLTYPDIKVGKISKPQMVTLENDGNDDLLLSAPALVSAALDSATTTCVAGSAMPLQTSCSLGIEFAPTVTGTSVLGSVTVPSNAGNTPSVVNISGQVLSVNPVTVTLTSSLNPSMLGAAVTFTATVASDDAGIGGPVTFYDGTIALCTAIPISAGTATCTTVTLALGQHSITANYAGDPNNEAKTSAALTQVVQQGTTVTLTASPNPAVVGTTVTIAVAVTAANGTPTGAVVFYDGTTALTGNVALNNGGAVLSTAALTPGTHTLTVQYAGDASDAPGTSNAVSEVINQAGTTTTLASSNADVVVGTAVTFSATVTSANGSALTGSVTFSEGGTVLGTGSLVAAGSSSTASFVLSSLTPGKHNIVATYGGDTNDAGSKSQPLVQTIEQIPTVTTLGADNNSPTAGATVNLTATVAISGSAAADGPITGTVTFRVGSTVLGTAQVNASGKATLAVILPAGAQSVVAAYAGNTNYAASSSGALLETVSTTATTTALSGSATSTLAGKPITFTATVSSSTGTPTGSVAFMEGALTLGSATLNKGSASFTTSSLAVATHAVTAVYSGDSNYVTSTSSPVSDVVSLATTSVSLSGPTKVDVGTTVNLTGALASNGLTPTGALTLLDGSNSVMSQNVAASGSFVFSTASMSIGTHTLTVSYGGDSNNAGSVSQVLTLVVQQSATATSLVSSANPSTLGQPLTLTASVTSSGAGLSGAVNFLDGSTSVGSATLVNGTATLTTSALTFGPHNLTAVYAGDTNHAASTSTVLLEQIVEPSAATLTSSVNPATAGSNVVFTARIAPVGTLTPTGSVTFLDGTGKLSVVTLDGTGTATYATTSLAVGAHSISFTYPGDKNFAAATASLTETIRNSDTQVALTASANPATYGTPLGLMATVTTNGGTATGTVTFTEGGKSLGDVVLDASGAGTLTLSTLAPGVHALVANYLGDGKASPSASSPLTVTVLQTTTTALASSANPAYSLGAIVLTATVTNSLGGATGGVTFTDGATQLGVVQLDAKGVATLSLPSLSVGSHSLLASYAGDGSDFPSSGTLTQTVQLRPTTTSLSSTQTDPKNPQQVTLIAVVHYSGTTAATGTLAFSNGGSTLGTAPVDATGVATLTTILAANATVNIVATYSGDASYASSSSPATAITGGEATQFTLTLSSSTMSVQSMQHGTVTLTAASVKGFNDMLEFGCLGQPFASTCTFSKTQMQLAADGTATVQLTIDTGNPLGSGAAANVAGSGRMLLLSLPLTLLLSLVWWRTGRRFGKLPSLLLVAFAAAVALSATGCAGISVNGTPPGTYTFFVTASGKGTGATQSQAITLNVTK